eukprot:6618362-Lingulodinium_polyedra.AAC.1
MARMKMGPAICTFPTNGVCLYSRRPAEKAAPNTSKISGANETSESRVRMLRRLQRTNSRKWRKP